MNILILGEGAGAHFLAQLFSEDPIVETVYHLGYNREVFSNNHVPFSFVPVFNTECKNITEFLDTTRIDLIVPTSLGFELWEDLIVKVKELSIPALMPDHKLAMLEWSKIKGKQFLLEADIPTADHTVYAKTELFEKFYNIQRPFVVKYEQDWRAGLQTVVITDDNIDEQFAYLQDAGSKRYMKMHGEFKNQHFIVEKFITGTREYSYHVLINSTGWVYLGSARDYKKRYEGDVGHNTASFGSYAEVTDVDPVIATYVDKFIDTLAKYGKTYTGVLYLGIMETADETVVLEINTRLGDPELHSILSVVKNSVAELFYNCAANKEMQPVVFSDKKAVSIRIVNKDYTLKDERGPRPTAPMLILLPDNIRISYNVKNALLFCVITATHNSIGEASDVLYDYLKNKDMGAYTYRTDIGYLK